MVASGVAVRMMFHRKPTIGFFQIVLDRIAGHTEDFVIVAFAHRAEIGSRKSEIVMDAAP
jgi:hypothetical protein